MSTQPTRSAVKFDLFADQAPKRKIEVLGDPLQIISRHIDFAHLARFIDELFPRKDSTKGGRPPYLARCGQIIDATLVSAPIQHFTKADKEQLDQGQIPGDWSAAKRGQKDLDATHTKKHGKRYHGYKLSVSVEVRHKFIRQITTGTASEHDSTHFDEVPDDGNTSADVYADKGYPSGARSEMLKVLGFREHIQRKAQAGKPLSECQRGRNKRIAKSRARVEHPFAQMHHMGGKIIRTIGQARATAAMTMKAACYTIKRLAQLLRDGEDAFYKAQPSKTKLRLRGGQV